MFLLIPGTLRTTPEAPRLPAALWLAFCEAIGDTCRRAYSGTALANTLVSIWNGCGPGGRGGRSWAGKGSAATPFQGSHRRRTATAFCPPIPRLIVIAVSMSALRARCGTNSRANSGSGSLRLSVGGAV